MAGLETLTVALGERTLSVTVRRSPLARSISVRVDAVRGIVLVLPSRGSLATAQRFLLTQRDWLAARVEQLPQALPLIPGAHIPLFGEERLIRHRPDARRGVWLEGDEIHVCGQSEHVPRRIGDFLKAEARRLMVPRAHDLAARIGRKPNRVTFKDTVSRWGSCSAQGHIALSWRLVMAPPWVADYVVGHEVAHLAEMNHSAAFWAVVHALGVDPKRGRDWLKAHGARLHRYQPD